MKRCPKVKLKKHLAVVQIRCNDASMQGRPVPALSKVEGCPPSRTGDYIGSPLHVSYLALFNWRTKRSSKNCAGTAFLASTTVSDMKSKMPRIPGSEIISSRLKPALR